MKAITLRDINERNRKLWTPDRKLVLPAEGGGDLGPYLQRGATHEDGIADLFLRSALLAGVGVVNTGVVFSAWVNPTLGVDPGLLDVEIFSSKFHATTGFAAIDPQFGLFMYDDSGYDGATNRRRLAIQAQKKTIDGRQGVSADLPVPASFPDGKFHHILGAIDFATLTVQALFDAVLLPVPDADAYSQVFGVGPMSLDYSVPADWCIGGAHVAVDDLFDQFNHNMGCLAEIFWTPVAAIPNFSVEANVLKFRDKHGKPANLGPQGQFALGTRPAVYSPLANEVNLGYGGSFVKVGGPTVCGSHP